MEKYFFFCPNCKHEETADTLPMGTVGNIRDGFGTPINHFECPICHNLDAGYMRLGVGRMLELNRNEQTRYFKDVIALYQGIRGFAENKQ